MNELLSRPLILLVFSMVLLGAAGLFVTDIPEIIVNNRNSEKSKFQRISTESFDIIDQALKESVRHDFFTFAGDFESPFRLSQGGLPIPGKSQSAPSREVERIKLQLKGILSKEKPLAILEDQNGQTYICGVGDSVANQVVYAITGSKVGIIDNKGKYEISVEEQ